MLSVLVVEGVAAMAESLRDVLEEEGHAVTLAQNGREALASMRERRPSLVLLDLQMPEMDGAAFRAAQLADPALASVPVIVLTGARPPLPPQVENLVVIEKPFDYEALIGAVAVHARGQPTQTGRDNSRA